MACVGKADLHLLRPSKQIIGGIENRVLILLAVIIPFFPSVSILFLQCFLKLPFFFPKEKHIEI